MNVTETSQHLITSITPQEIKDALRKAQTPKKLKKNTVRGQSKRKVLIDTIVPVNKNIRPLNSYMAFRSYYSTIFTSVQQKEISGFVTYMWQADPFKAQWAILAKAYSAIRHVQGKTNAPLDQFLTMNTPLVGIIEPDKYLQALGWIFVAEPDGDIIVQREEPKYNTKALSTGISVNGVIRNCFTYGYYTGRLSDVLLANDEATVTVNKMTIANEAWTSPVAQPGSQAHENGSLDMKESPKTSLSTSSAADVPSMIDQNNGYQEQQPIDTNTLTPTASEISQTLLAFSTDAPAKDASGTIFNTTQLTVYSPRAEHLFPADFRLPPGEFALDEAFDPLLYNEQSVFDPFAGNQFDAFDLNDGWDEYINFDACA